MGLILDGTTGISASGNIYGANIIVTNNFSPSALSVVGNVQGDYIKGNGSLLTGVIATTAATVTTAAQPNITSVGTLTSLTSSGLISTTGNIAGGNVLYGAGQVSGTGSMYATAFVGSLTGAATSAVTAATVTTAAQPNITSVGTLSSLSVTGNINGGNITTVGTASIGGFTIGANTITAQGPTLTIDPNASGGVDGNVVIQGNLVVNGNMTYINSNNITTNDLTINMANNAATATAANGGGIEVGPAGAAYISLTYNSASNIWVASNGLSVVGVVQTAGNISGGNVLYGSGQVSGTGSIYATAFVGSLTGTATSAVSATSAGSATTAATVTTAAQPNITSTGTLTSVTTSGALTVNSANNATAIVNGGTTGGGNIGATGATFNTVFAKATTAQYADLAEKYTADATYPPGTVVSFGGDCEVTMSLVSGDRRVAGVISTDPGFLMNEGLTGTTATVALTGRVPTSVTGRVRKGDLMVSNGDGSARAEDAPATGSVIGKSLVDFDGETGTIEIVVGRL